MKKIFMVLCVLGGLFSKDFGTYVSIDEEGKETAYWNIYEENGNLYGKITKLVGHSDDEICKKCKKTYTDFTYTNDASSMKLVGAPLLYNLRKEKENTYKNGYIIDPKSGKLYKANATFKDDTLELRGYIGFSLIGRTQVWKKVQ